MIRYPKLALLVSERTLSRDQNRCIEDSGNVTTLFDLCSSNSRLVVAA